MKNIILNMVLNLSINPFYVEYLQDLHVGAILSNFFHSLSSIVEEFQNIFPRHPQIFLRVKIRLFLKFSEKLYSQTANR